MSCLGEPLWLSLTVRQSGEAHVSLPSQVPLACCLNIPLLWTLFVVWGFVFFKVDAGRSFCCEIVVTSGKCRAGFYDKMPCGWPGETPLVHASLEPLMASSGLLWFIEILGLVPHRKAPQG